MLTTDYNDLVQRIHCNKDARDAAAASGGKFSEETLLSLFEQAYRVKLRMRSKEIWTNVPQYQTRYKQGERIVEMADDVPPTLLAVRILEAEAGKKTVKQWLKEPGTVDDQHLRADLRECLEKDEQCGPRLDKKRLEIGCSHEELLESKLKQLCIEYETETDLRRRSQYKTPDVLLAVPIGMNGRVVNWIDSKAKFGDFAALDDDYRSSIASYTGRYGPGLVIYWFDFVEDATHLAIHRDQGVLLSSGFPTDVYLLPGTTIPPPTSLKEEPDGKAPGVGAGQEPAAGETGA